MDFDKFREFKREFLTGKNFSAIWIRFLDEFVEDKVFLRMGHPVKGDYLAPTLIQTAARVLNEETIVIAELRLIAVPQFDLVHGTCFINGMMSAILYLKDVQTGILSITTSFVKSQTLFARFVAGGDGQETLVN
jgi:hypothetical protein